MNLSEHFTLAEMTRSDWAIRHDVDNTAPVEVQLNLRRLCDTALEPMRALLGRPIIVSSGYRSMRVNIGVGGAAGSAHLDGRAADINAVGMSSTDLANWIRKHDFPIDKCIDEFGRWVHVQIAAGSSKPRGQYLVARKVNGKTVYEVMA